MMSRAYVVYVLMFAALIGGMALIWTMGDSVRAPDDLSGEWIVEWDNAPPPESGEPKMRIAQSGRFFVVTFGQRPPMSMTLKDGWTGKSTGRTLNMKLARPQWELRLNGPVPAKNPWRVPELKLELVGPTRHLGIARRVLPETAAVETGAQARTTTTTTQPIEITPTASVPAAETAHAR